MSFPDIPTGGRVLTGVQANTTAARTFPSLSSLTKNSGDLLLALIYGYQSSGAGAGFTTWGGGFTDLRTANGGTTNGVIGSAYKFSNGAETGTFTVTQSATITGHAAMILMSISGNHVSEVPATNTIAVGTSAAADPTALGPSFAPDDILWMQVCGIGETSTAGSFTGLSASPTNYGSDVISSISADAVGGVQIGVGFQQLNTSSENAGGWTLDTSNARNSAFTIAVRPALIVPTQLPFVVKPQSWRWL